MPPKKRAVQKRTPGFTTTDKEVHDALDTVRPVAERVYRKLHQRMNVKRGDRVVFPTWEQLISDTGISNRRTLDKAIKELESVGLIAVDRSYNPDLQRRNVNRYYISTSQEISQWQNYQKPVANLPKASGKSATVTRMKRTSMNLTSMNKGTVGSKGKKKELNNPPSPLPPSPGATNQKEKGQWQNGTGSESADERKRRRMEWEMKQKHPTKGEA
jgi:hypothetical protein